ncbi:MAG: methyltransferase [Bifidobacterium merycicum]|uniref:Methyltransferase n=1 Tax=Bifidobacterium merycicum TaxID=78345 RepID=A0A087BHE1_9BIFI|nr:methyltransferase [Bifidobacterium merycicum]KFI70441.1 methyltransferase [Bifidobacterium merycicum]MEE1294548.1 methyltransferase [Bifidobacterium merycicum]MEE3342218.1 methyltransferase [Bifidobacterium merycicum]SHE49268.1 Predicted O-methyltransferase YrrM [Bifidobacterium merycicum DSM 6492]
MNHTTYENLAKVWDYVEEHATVRQSAELVELRHKAQEAGMPQGSATQAALLSTLVRLTNAKSVIAIGTGSLVETLELVRGLDGEGQLTAVDSSAEGIALIRKSFDRIQDGTGTTLRAVNATAGTFLPRLNANVYDLIVVAGDVSNYASSFEQASRLLRPHGTIVFTDMLALEHDDANGGVINPADRSPKATAMRELLETVESDERFDTALTSTGTGLLIAVKR